MVESNYVFNENPVVKNEAEQPARIQHEEERKEEKIFGSVYSWGRNINDQLGHSSQR